MLDLIKIRRAESSDVLELAAIGYLAWEAGILPLFRESAQIREEQKRRLSSYTQECYGRIIVALLDDEIVGWCSYARGRPYIPFLFVAPYMQNYGIGSALLRRMEAYLELLGYDRVYLETPADHIRAVHFYERQGYGIMAMKADGHSRYKPLMSIRLEKRLSPYTGSVD